MPDEKKTTNAGTLPQTEIGSPRFESIETWSTGDIVSGLVEGQMAALGAVHSAQASIAEAIDLALPRLQRGGRLIYVGAGTSGRIATQDAAELTPTFNWPAERSLAIIAGGSIASTEAIEGAEDNETEAIAAMKAVAVGAADVVIGVAASGRTPFTLAALAYARASGAMTVAVVNNPVPQEVACDVVIVAQTGSEFLAGSTRLGAGTAQKVILNCLSTALMIRLGYVYKGLMVEMQPTNRKLRQRAIRIVSQLTGADAQRAEATLADADWHIKLAVVMLARSCDKAEADRMLAAAGGLLSGALSE